MTRRPTKNNAGPNEEEVFNASDSKNSLSPLCNGYTNRTITRQSSQELLKVQCNGLTTTHRNSKLLSPSGSDVLPLPTSRRSTRRASASWCGSTRELSQLSPTDSEIENIRRSDSSFEAHDPSLDSPGITLRPKGQLWLPIALIGTTAEENGNCIRKRYEYSIRHSENAKLSSDVLDSFDINSTDETDEMQKINQKENESIVGSNCSLSDCQIGKDISDKQDSSCAVTRRAKVKNEETNGRSRESSMESNKSEENRPKSRVECKKRSLSVCDRTSPTVKRTRTMSTNSIHSVSRKKKLSPEEKLLQDNKEYFKMEVLNSKLRSTGSLLGVTQSKELEVNEIVRPTEKVEQTVIKKATRNVGRRRKQRRTMKPKPENVDLATNKTSNVKINGIIKKKRQSTLMKLCNEAECFMFGESCKQIGNIDIDKEGAKGHSKHEVPQRKRHFFTSSRANASADSNFGDLRKTRRKRRSQAEAFIHDNIDYYKFETPGSRLRYQGTLIDVKSEDKDFVYTLKNKKKEINKKNDILDKLNVSIEVKEERPDWQEKKRNPVKPSDVIEKILFSFESIPVTEPWYEVYKRQDEGLENYYPLFSNPSDKPFLLPYELPKPMYCKAPTVSEYYKRRRKKLLHLFNHPRKSPRCHASTLAILSSLKKRKRRSGTNISMTQLFPESPPHNLSGSEEKTDNRHSEREESEDILDFLYDDEADSNEMLLEPFSFSETRATRKNSDSSRSTKSEEDDVKQLRASNRSKKSTKSDGLIYESEEKPNEENSEYFTWHKINPDDHFNEMVIETKKKSGLSINVATILETYRNCRSMEDPEGSPVTKSMGSRTPGSSEKNGRRKKKKARKINKTGWDNRKSRRRTGTRTGEVKDSECSTVKKKRIKTKVKTRGDGISTRNIIRPKSQVKRGEGVGSLRMDDRPVLRSHLDVPGSVASRKLNNHGKDSGNVLRVKRTSDASVNVRLKCTKGRYTCLQKRRLMLNKKKKRVRDYAWTTKKR
ncbi:hypothetical protein RUM43_014092 [Polyplax serrata]|uniref:Uncharacterized protein n=1 Tax=Polyplax serrata TaxID=468196 RepID=A0AAN8NQ65_POLSC